MGRLGDASSEIRRAAGVAPNDYALTDPEGNAHDAGNGERVSAVSRGGEWLATTAVRAIAVLGCRGRSSDELATVVGLRLMATQQSTIHSGGGAPHSSRDGRGRALDDASDNPTRGTRFVV